MTVLTAMRATRRSGYSTLKAKWSSDQDRKDDGKFGSGAAAKSASNTAHKVSKIADRVGSSTGHAIASIYHEDAAAAHRAAASSGNSKFHNQQAAKHDQAAAHHDKKGEAAFAKEKKSKVRASRVVSAIRIVAERAPATSLKASMRFGASVRMKANATSNGNHPFSGIAYTGGIFYPTITVGGREERGAAILDLDTLTIPSPERPVLDDHNESADGIIGKTTMIAVRRPQYDLPVKGLIYQPVESAQSTSKPPPLATSGNCPWAQTGSRCNACPWASRFESMARGLTVR